MLICANDFVKSSILCGLRGISFYFVTVFIVNFSFGEFLMLILIFGCPFLISRWPWLRYDLDLQQTRIFFNINLLLPCFIGTRMGQAEKVPAEFETNRIS